MSAGSIAGRRRRRREILWGVLALAVALALAGSAAWLFFGHREAGLDPATLCPVTGPKGHVILLVDKTDPFNFTQKQAFLQYLAEFGRGRVKEGELFSVFALGEDFTGNARPVFEMCNPGRGEDKNIWTSNPEKLRRLFDERFLAPMAALADQLAAETPAPQSPIMEMLQLVAINGFRARNVAGPRRLFVVSDMLQNTQAFSQYRGDTDFAAFRETPMFQKARTDLAGVDVELAYLLNNPSRQTRRHLKFWEDYFEAMGAAIVAVRLLEG
jgi:hypothetical protein